MVTDSEKRKKKLVKYLADYIEQEMDGFEQGFGNDDIEIDSSLLADWLIYGIDAFESTKDVKLIIQDDKRNAHPTNMTECEDKKAENFEIICDECESRRFCGG